MSSIPPPIPNVDTFNNYYWQRLLDENLMAELDANYLRFPVAQGNESLTSATISAPPAAGDNSSKVPTTGWVLNEIGGGGGSTNSVYKTYNVTGDTRNVNVTIPLTAADNPTATTDYMVFVTYYGGYTGSSGTYTVSQQSAIFAAQGNIITNRTATGFGWNFWNGPEGDDKNMLVCFRIDFLEPSQVPAFYPVSWS